MVISEINEKYKIINKFSKVKFREDLWPVSYNNRRQFYAGASSCASSNRINKKATWTPGNFSFLSGVEKLKVSQGNFLVPWKKQTLAAFDISSRIR